MQAQYYLSPFRHEDIYNTAAMYIAPESNQYLPTGGLDHVGFSRGSSLTYPHQEYHYFPDRGGPTSQPECSSSLSAVSLYATGIANTGNPLSGSNFFQSEGIPDCQLQQQWRQWLPPSEPLHGVSVQPTSVLQPPEFLSIKSTTNYANGSQIVLSPAAQLPTPASMAILLNPNSRSKRRPPQAPSHSANTQVVPATALTRQLCPVEPESLPVTENLTRERKHGCTMCHKRFDRPSTLKKHLLVHTGEKAFVCDTCGRRFGVASNLNRHVKRCILKPVNAPARQVTTENPISATIDAVPPSPSSSNTSGSSTHANPPTDQGHLRGAIKPPAPKRRRRPPSPSLWVPASLLTFNLSPPESQKATPVPLPPVKRNLPKEERDSWDENVSSSPYHPRGWKNVLPGPGLGIGLGFGGKDVRNLNFGGNGGLMLGRVLVF